MLFYRKAYKDLLDWKNKKSRFPIIIRGLRQIGKSFLAEEFAKKEYGEEYAVILDFRHDSSLYLMFKNNNNERLSVDNIITNIKLKFPEKTIIKGKTCIVMDEIGDCPLARESFKLFKDNSGYDIIATGSLLGLSEIKGNGNDIPIGYEEYLDMTPMDFEEFMLACKVKKENIDVIRKSLINFKEIPETFNNTFHALLLRYIIVGGMPRVVQLYLETKDLNKVHDYQRSLCRDFEADFGKYKDKNGNSKIDAKLLIRTSRAYASLSAQLAKENKKFKYSIVEGGGRSSEFSDAIAWLNKTNIITLAHNLSTIERPLQGNAIVDEFKVYPSDIGLLISSFPISLVSEILDDKLDAYKGAIYEGLVADILYKAHYPLYYYSDSKKHVEIDFIIEEDNEISFIEVKANNGKIRASKSIKENKTISKINNIYKLINGNFGVSQYFKTLPQYALLFLLEKINNSQKEKLILKDN